MTRFNNNLEAALLYSKLGWRVLPCFSVNEGKCSCGNDECKSPGKHPKVRDWGNAASADEATIRSWWVGDPGASIGVATGPESRIWVLDLDGDLGIASWQEQVGKHGAPPTTVEAKTGKGRHLYFKHPPDLEIRSRAKIDDHKSIDVRGKGGYVIAPPSPHISGRSYEWSNPPGETPLADAPDWLIRLVTERREKWSDAEFAWLVGELDLLNDPGVPEGERHNRALELIGSHLGKGEDPFAVLQHALRWADKCQPKHDWDDITRIVRDLYFKDLEKVDDVPANEIPTPVLGEEALHGLAGEIVRAMEPETEADPAGILAQLLVYFGNAAGRHSYYRTEATRHYPNLFTVLVGETAKARKGTSEARVKAIFDLAEPEWTKTRIHAGLTSGEGVIWAVRDPIVKKTPIKDKGRIIEYQDEVVDHGIKDKRLLVVETEFVRVLQTTKREGNILSVLIRQAWDGELLQQLTKNSPGRATGAHISAIGHITKEELIRSLPTVEMFNGFAQGQRI